MKCTQVLSITSLAFISTMTFAKPMPNSIIVDDKSVVPVVKTQVIRRAEGQTPVRTVSATIFEVTNQGRDIVAREIELQDQEDSFSEKQMATPVIQSGGVIIPTSKVELNTQTIQDGQVIYATKSIDAAGVELKKEGEVIQRGLKLEQVDHPEAKEKVTRAVSQENGVTTRDVIMIKETE